MKKMTELQRHRKTAITMIRSLRMIASSDKTIVRQLNADRIKKAGGRPWCVKSLRDFERAWVFKRGWVANKKRIVDVASGRSLRTDQTPVETPKPREQQISLFGRQRLTPGEDVKLKLPRPKGAPTVEQMIAKRTGVGEFTVPGPTPWNQIAGGARVIGSISTKTRPSKGDPISEAMRAFISPNETIAEMNRVLGERRPLRSRELDAVAAVLRTRISDQAKTKAIMTIMEGA